LTQYRETEREKARRSLREPKHHDYHILETFEAGVVLVGTEWKAIREGRVKPARQFPGASRTARSSSHIHIAPTATRLRRPRSASEAQLLLNRRDPQADRKTVERE